MWTDRFTFAKAAYTKYVVLLLDFWSHPYKVGFFLGSSIFKELIEEKTQKPSCRRETSESNLIENSGGFLLFCGKFGLLLLSFMSLFYRGKRYLEKTGL